MNKIKYPWAKPVFCGREKEYLCDALLSTWISGGPYVERFEDDFGRLIKSPYVLTTSNGTTALYLAMLALGIGPGDEVIIPAFTFLAAANMVIATGAKPVFVDVDQDTWCIDPISVQKAITSKTKAICAVHLYGNVCDMGALTAICRKHRLLLIEDVAEAAFSTYRGRFAGTMSDVGTFSFQATKTIAMGEGGCITVKNKALFNRMTLIRNHGMDRKRYWHTAIGHNFRLPNLQAAIGCAQLEGSRAVIQRKKEVYQAYQKHLLDMPGITMQVFRKEVDPVVWAVAVLIDPKVFRVSRDSLIEGLLKLGIETRPGFYPVQTMPLYRKYAQRQVSVAGKIGANSISLPSYPTLTQEQIAWICSQLRGFVR